MSDDVLARLTEVLEARRGADPGSSYVAGLYAGGIDRILKKVGEEAIETVIAAKDGNSRDVICETADLWFHTLVMLVHLGIEPQQVLNELARRFGVSGLEEKASRNSGSRDRDSII